MTAHLRRWLPPLCLVALVAAVWAVPYNPRCPDDPWGGGAAIALVGDECVYTTQFRIYLSDMALNYDATVQASAADESQVGDYLRTRNELVDGFGMENAAFATLALDAALYRAAISRGYVPRDDEVMALMGQARERIGNLLLLMELQELAQASDFEGFRSLIESPRVGQLIAVQGEEHLLLLFEQARELDFSGAKEGLDIHLALLETIGPERYWTEIHVKQARWLLAIEALSRNVAESEADRSGVLDWLDFRETTWSGTAISLADAAPDALNLESVRSYMEEIIALERDFLDAENMPLEDSPDDSGPPGPTPDS